MAQGYMSVQAVEMLARAINKKLARRPGASVTVKRASLKRRESNVPAVLSPAAGAISLAPEIRQLASLIDHTMLCPEATRAQIMQLCEEALSWGFAAVCVHSAWVPLAAERLRGSPVKVGATVAFPFGANLTAAKCAEAEMAIQVGAQEIDVVMNIGALRSGDMALVEADVRAVADLCHARKVRVKVILENAYLDRKQKVKACQLIQQAGADFVKTSTGLAATGATVADVRLMRKTVGREMGVKAAGGIRTLSDALRLLAAGANRLGTSAGVTILTEAQRRLTA